MIVRADTARTARGSRVEGGAQAAERGRRRQAIVAEEELHMVAAGLAQAPVPVGHHADVPRVDMEPDAGVPGGVGADDLGRAVVGGVVADQQLEIAELLGEDGIDAAGRNRAYRKVGIRTLTLGWELIARLWRGTPELRGRPPAQGPCGACCRS